MKKTIFILSTFSFFTLAATAYAQGAQGFVALAPIPGLTDASVTSVVNSTGFASFFNNLYKYCIGLSAALAVIMIIWGGLEISTKDSVSQQSNGRERITQAILGLILVLSPVLVFTIINPRILNLSVALPPINLSTPPPVQVVTGACPQYFTGTPPNCVALPPCTNVITTMCTPVSVAAFDEGPYPTPPTGRSGGVWCYQIDFTYQGNNYMCYRNQTACQASCRTSGVTIDGHVYARMPNSSDPNCAVACVNTL